MVEEKVFPVDNIHGGIRFVLPFVLGIGYFLSIPFIRFLFSLPTGNEPSYAFPLACLGSVPLAIGIMVVSEQLLLRFWPSGREIRIAGKQVQFWSREKLIQDIDLRVGSTPLVWYFAMGNYPRGGRERLVNKDWYCVACQLQSEGDRIIFFAFMPLNQAEPFVNKWQGVLLDMSDLYGKKVRRSRGAALERPKLPTGLVTGDNGRFWLAERNRWLEGLEATPSDFEEILQLII